MAGDLIYAFRVMRLPLLDIGAQPQHAPRLLDERRREVAVAVPVGADGLTAGQAEQGGDLVGVEQVRWVDQHNVEP